MGDTELRRTSLHTIHEGLGARMIDFGGWSMPVWYGSATDEHRAVRTAAGLFDLGHMGELMVTGPQAAAALDHSLLLHASKMPIGRARYSMIVNVAGGIIDDLIVYRLAEDRFLVVPNASNTATVFDEMTERAADFDAQVSDETDAWALVAIQGPSSERLLADLVDLDLATVRYYRIDDAEILGQRCLVARTGYTGEDGFELFAPASFARQLWEALASSGEPGDVVPCGLGCRDTLRLEAGMPLYGNELTLETTPFDVGSARLVDFDAPDFVGRAALVAAAEEPHRSLVGLRVDGRRPARGGYEVRLDGASIGVVTSGAPSPTLDDLICIASVERSLEPAMKVEVDVRGTATAATVVELPFYKRPSPQ